MPGLWDADEDANFTFLKGQVAKEDEVPRKAASSAKVTFKGLGALKGQDDDDDDDMFDDFKVGDLDDDDAAMEDPVPTVKNPSAEACVTAAGDIAQLSKAAQPTSHPPTGLATGTAPAEPSKAAQNGHPPAAADKDAGNVAERVLSAADKAQQEIASAEAMEVDAGGAAVVDQGGRCLENPQDTPMQGPTEDSASSVQRNSEQTTAGAACPPEQAVTAATNGNGHSAFDMAAMRASAAPVSQEASLPTLERQTAVQPSVSAEARYTEPADARPMDTAPAKHEPVQAVSADSQSAEADPEHSTDLAMPDATGAVAVTPDPAQPADADKEQTEQPLDDAAAGMPEGKPAGAADVALAVSADSVRDSMSAQLQDPMGIDKRPAAPKQGHDGQGPEAAAPANDHTPPSPSATGASADAVAAAAAPGPMAMSQAGQSAVAQQHDAQPVEAAGNSMSAQPRTTASKPTAAGEPVPTQAAVTKHMSPPPTPVAATDTSNARSAAQQPAQEPVPADGTPDPASAKTAQPSVQEDSQRNTFSKSSLGNSAHPAAVPLSGGAPPKPQMQHAAATQGTTQQGKQQSKLTAPRAPPKHAKPFASMSAVPQRPMQQHPFTKPQPKPQQRAGSAPAGSVAAGNAAAGSAVGLAPGSGSQGVPRVPAAAGVFMPPKSVLPPAAAKGAAQATPSTPAPSPQHAQLKTPVLEKPAAAKCASANADASISAPGRLDRASTIIASMHKPKPLDKPTRPADATAHRATDQSERVAKVSAPAPAGRHATPAAAGSVSIATGQEGRQDGRHSGGSSAPVGPVDTLRKRGSGGAVMAQGGDKQRRGSGGATIANSGGDQERRGSGGAPLAQASNKDRRSGGGAPSTPTPAAGMAAMMDVDGGPGEGAGVPAAKPVMTSFAEHIKRLEQMMLETQQLQDEVMLVRVQTAIASNRMTRLDNPIIRDKLAALARRSHEAVAAAQADAAAGGRGGASKAVNSAKAKDIGGDMDTQ